MKPWQISCQVICAYVAHDVTSDGGNNMTRLIREFAQFNNLINSCFYSFPEETKPPISKEVVTVNGADEGIRLQLAVAGFKDDDFEIFYEGNALTINGDNKMNLDVNEKFRCSFTKVFPVTKDLDLSKMVVSTDHGILSIFIPVASKIDRRVFVLGGKS
jgi:HSP20 family molecular chaperone IbpA